MDWIFNYVFEFVTCMAIRWRQARTLLGPKMHRYATYGSMAILVLLNYWLMAMLILVMSSRNPSATPLDDVSPLSRNRNCIHWNYWISNFVCFAPSDLPILTLTKSSTISNHGNFLFNTLCF